MIKSSNINSTPTVKINYEKLNQKIEELAQLFFEENKYFKTKHSKLRITQALVDNFLLEHNDIVDLSDMRFSYSLYGKLNSQLNKYQHPDKKKVNKY